MKVEVDTSQIHEYINDWASPAAILKGKQIRKRLGTYQLVEENFEYKYEAIYEVFDDGKHTIEIEIDDEGEVLSYCSCTDDGVLCPHQVAVLLDIENRPSLQGTNQPRSLDIVQLYREDQVMNGWRNFGEIGPIDQEFIMLHTASRTSHEALNCQVANEPQLEEDDVSFYVKENYSDYQYVGVFRKHKGYLYAKCNCNDSRSKACVHVTAILMTLSSKAPDFFVTPFDEQSDLHPDTLAKVAADFDIPVEKVLDYFQQKLTLGGRVLVLKEDFERLLPKSMFEEFPDLINKNKGALQRSFLDFSEEKLNLPVLGLEVIEHSFGVRMLGGRRGVSKRKKSGAGAIKPKFNEDGDWYSISEVDDKMLTLSGRITEESYSFRIAGQVFESEQQKDLHLLHLNHTDMLSLLDHADLFPYVYLLENSYYTYNQIKPSGDYVKMAGTFRYFLKIRKEAGGFISMAYCLKVDGHEVDEEGKDFEELSFSAIRIRNDVYFLDSHCNINTYRLLLEVNGRKVMNEQFSSFYNTALKPFLSIHEIEFENMDIISEKVQLKKPTFQFYISEVSHFILLKPVVKYANDDQLFNLFERSHESEMDGQQLKVKVRDLKAEKKALSQFQTLHPKFEKQGNQGFFNLTSEEFIDGYWFLDAFEKLREWKAEVFGVKELKNFNYATSKPTFKIKIKSEEDWFDVDVNVKIDDYAISLKDLKKQLVKQSNYVKLGDGRMAIIPEEWIRKLEKYLRAGELGKNGNIKVTKKRFNILDEIFDEKQIGKNVLKELTEKRERIKNFQSIQQHPVPGSLQATLRNYQTDGFNWLCFLHEFGWGGVLADDMGLGKTLQILSFICHLTEKGIKKPILAVLPTSLLFNWQNEIAKFCPDLDHVLYYGADRKPLDETIGKAKLVLTSYGLMTNDIDQFLKQKFSYVILDESQAIKNPSSQRYKAAMSLKTENRLAMTGTPIENNTFDLYAQMNFTNPGFLGSMESFRNQYSTPIDKHSKKEVAEELQKLVSPFLLRRTKEIVATELPEKTEDILYCEMGSKQRKVYDAYRNQMKLQILDKLEEDGVDQSKMIVLQALTKLRQICDSAALLSDDENYGEDSAKLEELVTHVKEKTGNHKILVFSQFVGMLDIIGTRLKKEKIKFEYLQGKHTTKQREKAVDSFQSKEDVRVFLISLKAGGTGLNLTAADYVYIVDPWWNPAVENQAIDRCYRIGQKNNVMAYRMICKDTVEEKILRHKSKKQEVADSLIAVDENVMKTLNKDAIVDLFS